MPADPSENQDPQWERVYNELKGLAAHRLRAVGPITMTPTVLVHEAYLRLGDQGLPQEKGHFLALASRAMRFILIDRLRHKQARGQDEWAVTLGPSIPQYTGEGVDALNLAVCLEKLAKLDERLVCVVECRLFAGMNNVETAEACDLSLRTVERLWQKGKLYLKACFENSAASGSK